jgi:hypothetical protein
MGWIGGMAMQQILALGPVVLSDAAAERGDTVEMRYRRPTHAELRAVLPRLLDGGRGGPAVGAPALDEARWSAGALGQLVGVLAEQNAQLAGQVLFLQGQVEATRARIALLEAPPEPAAARPRWRRLLGR